MTLRGLPLERAQVHKTTFRSLGLTICMLLAYTAGVSAWTVSAARAQDGAGGSESGMYIPQQPPLDKATFEANPQSLLTSQNLGGDVTHLLGQGVSSTQISQILAGAGASNTNLTQWTSVINGIASGNVNPVTAGALVNSLFGGSMNPQMAMALSSIAGLGNLSNPSQLISALGGSQIAGLFSGLSAQQAGGMVDQLLGALTGGQGISGTLSSTAIAALASQITGIAPQLASALGQAGLQTAIAGSLQQMAAGGLLGGIGGIGGALQGGGIPSAVQAAALGGGGGCCGVCVVSIPNNHADIKSKNQQLHVEMRNEISNELERQRVWLADTFWHERILPALMLMAEQLTTLGMEQVEIIGTFLDAKQQLEVQRKFQTLTARAHKDYHPSEGMCTFGTTVRSLAASERKSNLSQIGVAQRMMQRQTLNGDVVSTETTDSDRRSRMSQFISTYCDPADNANGLTNLCGTPVPDPYRRNIDVDYTRNVESRLTLDLDLLPPTSGTDANPSKDEADIFALSANLYAHKVPTRISPTLLGTRDGRFRKSALEKYMDLRSVFAQRSVAQNSFAAITSMRAAGTEESAPYTKAIMRELGISTDDEINKLLGENPSYFAQMEVLTKKLYQNPIFYTELYDQPTNIRRKGAALQAIGLMQDRDLYNSLLRSEAVLSVLLENMLEDEQEEVVNAMGDVRPTGVKQ